MEEGIDSIVSRIAILLYKNFKQHLYKYVESEIQEINKELSENGFLTLLMQKRKEVNLGKKYVPFFKLNKTRELNQLNLEVSSLFSNILQNEFKSKISIFHKNINS